MLHAIKDFIPRRYIELIRPWIYSVDHQLVACREVAERLYGGRIPDQSDYTPRFPIRLGILKDHASYYVYNVMACRDLGVSYVVLDLGSSDWLAAIRDSGCAAILVWPSTILSAWKQMYDERLKILVEALGFRLVPRLDEIWLLESKRRVADWCMSRGVPCLDTRVYYDRDEATDFIRQTDFPLVCKLDAGASSGGIFILRSKAHAEQMVHRAFSRGLATRRGDRRDRQRGNILFQKYHPHDYEWRIVRIGPWFLSRRKVRLGDFASGSGAIGWAMPPAGMLDFVRQVTDLGHFESMGVDVFENTPDHPEQPFLVNELQCVFGAIQHEEEIGEATGRWHWDVRANDWQFEPGFFYQNACSNLRIQLLLDSLSSPKTESL